MTNYEIEKGEIIRQNGIVNVLEQMGFKENEDFIFLRNGDTEPYVFVDGDKPLFAIRIYSGKENPMQVRVKYENGKDVFKEIPVISEYDMNRHGAVDESGYFRYGITSGNNGIYAIYVPFQGMVISPKYEIKKIMETEFHFKETGFGVPLSNGAEFRDKSLQDKWRKVRDNEKYKDESEKKFSPEELEQKRKDNVQKYEKAISMLSKTVEVEKMPLWAQEQLKNRNSEM